MVLQNPIAAALLASLASHLFFKTYEPTDVARLVSLLVLPPLIIGFLPQGHAFGILGSLLRSYSAYYAGLLLSVITYRLSPVHPLSRYPGPAACKISKLWLTFVTSRGKLHIYIKGLHDKYGSVVRIGPNELSITDVSLLPFILGANGMPKGPMWQGRKVTGKRGSATGVGNLVGSRDSKLHAEARKSWSKAFTPAAIKGYEPKLNRRVVQLVEALGAHTDGSVDLSQWLSFFSFDFMGDVVFGGGFELLRDGDKDGLWQKMQLGLYLPALTQQIPWCHNLLPYFPLIGQDMKALGKFAFEQSNRRFQEGSVHDDLFYHVFDGNPCPFPVVVSVSIVAIVAGSDTAATVLCNTFFLLLSHPESYKRLQLELDEAFSSGTKEPTAAKLASLPYLNAVIKESLRMFPPVPTSLQRAPTVGSGVKVFGERFEIPEGTSVIVPPYAMHRDPGYFSPSPEEYIPDRWIAGEDERRFITNEDAFIPFSTGPANCIGKNLAMLEIRMVVACIMQAYEMRFAEGYDTSRWEADLKDYFNVHKGSLPIIVGPRNA
ncbi:cytochrome P450 [Mycena polygramma]|nr:cytochrome P450 [Mycena polygramma]